MTYEKSISYDRETRDYAMYLDGELVGFARNHHEAEVTLDQLVFELMSGVHTSNAPTPVDAPTIEPASTCGFCQKTHHPQDCPDMRPLLFAPDVPQCVMMGCELPRTHDDTQFCCHHHSEETGAACDCDDEYYYAPLDLDFAPCGPEV